MSMRFYLCLVFVLSLFSTIVQAQSFDCPKAATEMERLICSNQELQKLDSEMTKLYKEALAIQNIDQTWLKQTQHEWIKRRDMNLSAELPVLYTRYSYKGRVMWLKNLLSERSAKDICSFKGDFISFISDRYDMGKSIYSANFVDINNDGVDDYVYESFNW